MICIVCFEKEPMVFYAISKTGTWYQCPKCKNVEHVDNSPEDPKCPTCKERHPIDERHL